MTKLATSQTPADAPLEKRLDRLLSAANAKDLVREMDAFSLYNLVRDADESSARELVLLSSAEQSQAFLDFDCWNRDSLDLGRLGTWLGLLVQSDDEKMCELSSKLDPELLGRFFRSHIEVYFFQLEEDEAILDSTAALVESSPDGVYGIVMPADFDDAALVRLVIHRLYVADQDAARQLLHAARWELNSVLEENAYRVRCGRLEQFGFLPTEEAIGLYVLVDPKGEKRAAEKTLRTELEKTVDVDSGESTEDSSVLSGEISEILGPDGSFFGRALRAAATTARDEHYAEGLARELVALINMSVAADLGDPSDRDLVSSAAGRVHGGLSIALEYLSDRDVERGASLLLRWPLKRLFSVGHSLVVSLSRQAQKLIKRENLSLVEELATSLCGTADGDLLDGLRQMRPHRSALHKGSFSRLSEVERATERLALVAYKELWTFGIRGHRKGELVQLLLGPPASVVPLDEVTFDSILVTAAVGQILHGTSALQLFSAADARTVLAEHVGPDGISDGLVEAISVVTASSEQNAGDSAKALAEGWATEIAVRLVEEYGHLDASGFDDLRFLPTLLLVHQHHAPEAQ